MGITVVNSLKPSSQCAKAAAKAMQVLGLIKRNFVLNDEKDYRLLFNGFVHPHLQYCVSVWSLYLRKDIECLEKVHRRATKLVKGVMHKSCDERLQLLGITSLEKRSVRGNLIQVFRWEEDVIFRPCGRENSPVCHFCPSLWMDSSGQCRLFPSTEFLCFFYFSPTKHLAPFLYMPHKNLF